MAARLQVGQALRRDTVPFAVRQQAAVTHCGQVAITGHIGTQIWIESDRVPDRSR